MKIYISEKDMPNNCGDVRCAPFACYGNAECIRTKTKLETCPLQSLEQHDNEVRREFAEKVKAFLDEQTTTVVNELTIISENCKKCYKGSQDNRHKFIDDLLKQLEAEE